MPSNAPDGFDIELQFSGEIQFNKSSSSDSHYSSFSALNLYTNIQIHDPRNGGKYYISDVFTTNKINLSGTGYFETINDVINIGLGTDEVNLRYDSLDIDFTNASNEAIAIDLDATSLGNYIAKKTVNGTLVETSSIGANNDYLLTANFNFDNENEFSDLGIDIDANFSVSSSTSTWIYGDKTGRAGFGDLSDFTISSEDLTNLFSDKAKNIEEDEIAIIKNEDDTYSIIKILDSKRILGDGDDIDGVTLNYGYLEKDSSASTKLTTEPIEAGQNHVRPNERYLGKLPTLVSSLQTQVILMVHMRLEN